ncbi:hypothetical protein STRDD10_01967 [Streptococcus sp. DD10]|nr:hypothetical protein STRDD10_01967 [Streptococcus sp. DD10]
MFECLKMSDKNLDRLLTNFVVRKLFFKKILKYLKVFTISGKIILVGK